MTVTVIFIVVLNFNSLNKPVYQFPSKLLFVSEGTAEDVTADNTTNPERLFFQEWQANSLFDAYENLDYSERTMVADHLGFCTECYGIYELGKDENGKPMKLMRKEKAYIDLAAEHMLSSPDSAFRIVNGAYEKMCRELTDKGVF